ncbi:MAG: hypothetical protein KGL39_51790 [Patescibacteria group bacterium]|nr:hypothetical protein [Patescibacteria group bacterium]
MSITDLIGLVEIISFVVGAYAALFPLRHHFMEQKRQNQRIEDALLGTEATKELPATPSLFFQVKEIKTDLTEVKRLTAQLKANGGKSFYDKVNQMSDDVTEIRAKLDEHIVETHGALR